MASVFSKLNLKDQSPIVVLNAPESFETELAALEGVEVRRSAEGVERVAFAIAFVQTLAQVEEAARDVLPKATGDAVVWFAYPKGSSKRYKCEFNRDSGWEALGKAGFEGVRQVAIDEDWSALRFRRVEYIKTMTRDVSRAATPQGKERVARPKE